MAAGRTVRSGDRTIPPEPQTAAVNAERALPAAVALLCAVAIVLSTGLLVAVQPRAGAPGPDQADPAGTDGVFDPERVGDAPGHGHFAATGGPNRLAYTVHADGHHYYRVSAYDRYTGAGWDRPPGTDSVDALGASVGAKSVDGDGSAAAGVDTVPQYYEVEHPTRAAAAVARPVDVDGPTHDVRVDELGTLAATDRLPEGLGYEVESRIDRPTPDQLRATAGEPYPAEVQARYTRLPSDVPASVAEKTDAIVDEADAETPYDTAAAIERWLESEKAFALRRPADGDRVAASFLFEQEGGYSEQFATTMVVMLRTQDVPARYVVGYTPSGTPDRDSHHLYAANAHAWVEAYFPEVGWVRFDPTPTGPRVATEQAAVEHARQVDPDAPTDGPYRPPIDLGSPGDRGGPAYDVQLNRTPVPGALVTATVTEGGEPVAGVTVLFDDEPVGTTGAAGRVTARVPYDERLEVAVGRSLPAPAPAPGAGSGSGPGASSTPGDGLFGSVGGLSPVGVGSAASAGDGGATTASAGASETARADEASADEQRADDGTRERAAPVRYGETVLVDAYPLETDASLELLGTPREGQPVRVRATVDGVPLRNGIVQAGDEHASTGADGVARIELPFGERAELLAEKGVVEGAKAVATEPWLNVSVAGHAVPGQQATVVASRNGEPVAGAAVTVDGRRVGTTGEDGRLTVRVPFDNDATVAATRGDAVGRHRATWLFAWAVPPLALAVGGLGWALVTWLGVPLAGAGAVGVAPLLVRAGRRVSGAILGVGVRVGDVVTRGGTSVGDALAWLGRRATGTVEWTVAALVGLAGTVADRGVPWLVGLPGRLRELGPLGVLRRAALAPVLLATGLVAAVGQVPGLFRAWLAADDEPTAGHTPAGTTDGEPGGDAAAPQLSLWDVWRRFVALAPVEAAPSRTPGELARAAVDAGLPERPVGRLTALFREARYGGRGEDARVDPARTALEAVRAALGLDDGPEPDAPDDAVDGTGGDGA